MINSTTQLSEKDRRILNAFDTKRFHVPPSTKRVICGQLRALGLLDSEMYGSTIAYRTSDAGRKALEGTK